MTENTVEPLENSDVWTEEDAYAYDARIAHVFTPGAPITEQDLFSGRSEQIEKLLSVIFQKGTHAVLFGERGVGKTSLAAVVPQIVNRANIETISAFRVGCSVDDDFGSIWRNLFGEISIGVSRLPAGFATSEEEGRVDLLSLVPDGDLTVHDVRRVLARLGDARVVLYIDEFDRPVDRSGLAPMADLIKALSDSASPVTVVLVGVADNVDELVAQHQSIERAVVQIRVPRMTVDELNKVIDTGIEFIQMTIDDDARGTVVYLAQGLPHFIHLIMQAAARTAVSRQSLNITMRDVREGITLALANAEESLMKLYDQATFTTRGDTLFAQVLLACAMAEHDDRGFFSPPDVREPLEVVAGRRLDIPSYSRHLHQFAESRGPVLDRVGRSHRYRFRFSNPLLRPYVLMKGIEAGLIEPVHLENVVA